MLNPQLELGILFLYLSIGDLLFPNQSNFSCPSFNKLKKGGIQCCLYHTLYLIANATNINMLNIKI